MDCTHYGGHMASILKKPTSQYWFACFSNTDGRRLKRSTKTTDKKLALQIAQEYEAATRVKRTTSQVRKVIAELHEQLNKEALPNKTIKEFVAEWLERKEPEVAGSTLVFYKVATGKFLRWLEADADRELSEITRQHVTDFRNDEAKRLAPKTVNHDLKCLRMVFKDARREGLISEDPSEFVEVVRQRKDANGRIFTLEQIKALLAVADPEWQSMILFGLYSGQRLSDLATLKWSNIDLARGVIRLATRKTGKEMTLPIAEPLREHLETLAAGDEPDAPLHPRACAIIESNQHAGLLSNQFADILAAAGLREKKPHRSTGKGRGGRRERQDLSFHRLRATAATLFAEAGIPAKVAQAFIGHDSDDMHALYISVGSDALEKAAASLPDVR